jgi:hypothetical protein
MGTEHAIPNVAGDTEVVVPKLAGVMQVVHRLAQPKAALRVLVLKLVSVGRERAVAKRAAGKRQAGGGRMQKAEGKHEPRPARVPPKLAAKALAHTALVMLDMTRPLQPHVHPAVAPVLDESAEHES